MDRKYNGQKKLDKQFYPWVDHSPIIKCFDTNMIY
jgi:hypothetical protein